MGIYGDVAEAFNQITPASFLSNVIYRIHFIIEIKEGEDEDGYMRK